jgi:hypothetical protein
MLEPLPKADRAWRDIEDVEHVGIRCMPGYAVRSHANDLVRHESLDRGRAAAGLLGLPVDLDDEITGRAVESFLVGDAEPLQS